MLNFLNLLISNIYLYIAIIAFLIIAVVILTIVALNKQKRMEIKEDYQKAELASQEEVEVEETVSSELENLIAQMQQDMEVRPEEVVAKFEQEQEEKAIISYQELVENVRKGKIVTIDDEESDIDFVAALEEEIGTEPIMVNEIEEKEDTVTKEQLKAVISEIEGKNKNIELEIKEEKPKFKRSEFVSPVFGTQKMDITYPTVNTNKHVNISIDKTVDLEELTAEIKKSEAFLNSLIEFRNNL